MSNTVLSLALAASLACLGWELYARIGGLEGLSNFVIFAVVCSPVCVLALGTVLWMQIRAGWPWPFAVGILALVACAQFSLIVLWGDSRFTYCFGPSLVAALSLLALCRGGVLLPPRPWMQTAALGSFALAIGVLAGAFGWRARVR